jgi:hypothetical protein
MNKKGQGQNILSIIMITIIVFIFLILIFWYLPHFAFGWDTGIMTGTIIGYDSKMFGTKSVFVLEDRTVFSEEKGMSQSQITLCSDFDDVEIHKLIEENINKKVIIEYQERRVGYYPFRFCHEAPITAIKQVTP